MGLDIFDRCLVIVVGKGGVGKSLVSVALVLGVVRCGKKVLVIEMTICECLFELFGCSQVFGYQVIEIFVGIDFINIWLESVLREYGLMKFKWKCLYKVVFENDVMKVFICMILGMNELLFIGKVWYLEQEIDAIIGKLCWDFIVLDVLVTGYGFIFFMVFNVIIEIVKMGFMVEEVEVIR